MFCIVEAAKTHPTADQAPAHDAYMRLPQRQPPDSQQQWYGVAPLIERNGGVLVLDDNTLDKRYALEIALVIRYWLGKPGRVVQSINLVSLVWTQERCCLSCDFRLYNKA